MVGRPAARLQLWQHSTIYLPQTPLEQTGCGGGGGCLLYYMIVQIFV